MRIQLRGQKGCIYMVFLKAAHSQIVPYSLPYCLCGQADRTAFILTIEKSFRMDRFHVPSTLKAHDFDDRQKIFLFSYIISLYAPLPFLKANSQQYVIK